MVQLNGQCLLAVNPTSAYHITGHLNNIPVNFMLDTGAPVSLIRKDVFDQVRGELIPWAGGGLVGVEGTPLEIHGMATVEIGLRGKLLPSEMVVASSLKAEAMLFWVWTSWSKTAASSMLLRGFYTYMALPFR